MVKNQIGGLAQMVERPLCMRKVQGSMPWSSILAPEKREVRVCKSFAREEREGGRGEKEQEHEESGRLPCLHVFLASPSLFSLMCC